MAILIKLLSSNKVGKVSYLYPTMEAIHLTIRRNYTRLSEGIQAELTFLGELAELTDDERFRESIAEVIFSLNELSDTLNLQRRYLSR